MLMQCDELSAWPDDERTLGWLEVKKQLLGLQR